MLSQSLASFVLKIRTRSDQPYKPGGPQYVLHKDVVESWMDRRLEIVISLGCVDVE
jgi:hypothetical protein